MNPGCNVEKPFGKDLDSAEGQFIAQLGELFEKKTSPTELITIYFFSARLTMVWHFATHEGSRLALGLFRKKRLRDLMDDVEHCKGITVKYLWITRPSVRLARP